MLSAILGANLSSAMTIAYWVSGNEPTYIDIIFDIFSELKGEIYNQRHNHYNNYCHATQPLYILHSATSLKVTLHHTQFVTLPNYNQDSQYLLPLCDNIGLVSFIYLCGIMCGV